MDRLCDKAKVKRFGFHTIRHMSASILYHLGYDVAVIQAILRHQCPKTTEKYLKSIGLEKARGALEHLSQRKGKVLEFKPKEPEVQKSLFGNKKPSGKPSTSQTAFA